MGWLWAIRTRAFTGRWIAPAGVLAWPVIAWGNAAPAGWPWPERTRDVTGTWLDAFNFLDLIPGPPFLLFYILFALVALVILRLLANGALTLLEPKRRLRPLRPAPVPVEANLP